jgi:hypothetical protein
MEKEQKRGFWLTIWITAVMLATITNCDKGTNPPVFTGPLELLQPKGGNGKSFKVGEPVTIKWSIHDQSKIGSVALNYSLDGGKTWVDSLKREYVIYSFSFTYPETTYVWTPTDAQKSGQFVLKVREYDDRAIKDQSAPFIIHE